MNSNILFLLDVKVGTYIVTVNERRWVGIGATYNTLSDVVLF